MPVVSGKEISRDIFRAYDIRGVVGKTLTSEVINRLGHAIGSIVIEHGENKIIVGRDGRLSGPSFFSALQKGILASGCSVIDIGLVTSPILYFATHILPVHSGIILTGSHNPADYNGLKIVLQGDSLSESSVYALYQRVVSDRFCDRKEGEVIEIDDMIARYTQRIKSDVTLCKPLRIVVDCGNGVAGLVAPKLFRALGCEVVELFCDVNGHFPNHHPDPSDPENLIDLIHCVQENHADVGLAFDGDGDRLGVITNRGKIIWPDRQLMLYAKDVLSRNRGSIILYDVKSTRYLSQVITECGGVPMMWRTGHSLIKAKMKEVQAPLAGEMSGHIFFNERWYGFDDALYAAARLLELLSQDERDCHEVFASFPEGFSTPELKIPISEQHKFSFVQSFLEQMNFGDAQIKTIDGVRAEFSDGWGLLRASNTTPHLIARFEADTQSALSRIQGLFKKTLLSLDPKLVLPF